MLIYVIESTITISLVEYNGLKLLVSGIPALVKTIESPREEVRLLRNGRDSGTSHTSPSHQLGRANAKSLRVKTGRRPGGQHGHEGSTLQIKEVPGETVDYIPQYCNGCGGGLQQSAAVLGQRRQEAVLPPVQARYVEHRSYSKICPHCGKACTGALPARLTAPIQYGSSVAALVSYLSVYQYTPYRRSTVLCKDLFSLPLSGGSIDNLLGRMAQKALPVYNAIQEKIQQSEVVGSDETGASYGGKKDGPIHGRQPPLPLSWHL